jgi:hypothetical protein
LVSDFAKPIYDRLSEFISDCESNKLGLNSNDLEVDGRVGDYIYDNYIELLKREIGIDLTSIISKPNERELKAILNGIFLMRAKRENIRSGCSNLFDLSIKNFSVYKEFKGEAYVELSKGYGSIVQKIIEKHRSKFLSKVHLKHFLKKIYLSPKLNNSKPSELYFRNSTHAKYTNDINKIVLLICDATNPNEPKDIIVVCDHVLCTMSLGFLKENMNSLIEPISYLPKEKRNAISRLGYGTVCKVAI